MTEELMVTARANELIDPSLAIWTWEVAMYLFLGGLTAGVMVFAAAIALLKKTMRRRSPHSSSRCWRRSCLSLGMTTLFLDLEHKLFVFRFYTSFQVYLADVLGGLDPDLIYPVSMLQILSTVRRGFPVTFPTSTASRWRERSSTGARCTVARSRWSPYQCRVALGIYTGILLSAFSARPFWNSGVLGRCSSYPGCRRLRPWSRC